MMKLIIVLGIKEFQGELNAILSGMKIPVFSKVDIEGMKLGDNVIDMANWFGKEKVSNFSVMFFTFVEEGQATDIIEAIDAFNLNTEGANSFHAFQIPVEKFV